MYFQRKENVVMDALSGKMVSALSLKDYDWRFNSDEAL